MKFTLLSALFTVAAFIISGCDTNTAETSGPAKLVTTSDTISYLIGNDIARSLKNIRDEIVPDIVFAGMKDALDEKDARIPADQERVIMQAFSEKMRQKQMGESNEKAKVNLEKEKSFLADNAKREGVVTTASGLQYLVIKEGDGPIPTDSSKVKVHYEGKLLTGKIFDSSIQRGQPATFGVNQVIKGWTEALKLMKVGSKYRLFIPSALAYGQRGMAHDIGPNTMLIFEVELLGIEK